MLFQEFACVESTCYPGCDSSYVQVNVNYCSLIDEVLAQVK